MKSDVLRVEAIIRELLDRFFGEYNLPMPELKIVNQLSARTLARCKWFKGAKNTEIEVQRSILGNESSLRRVLVHELIHHWQFLRTDQFVAISLAQLGVGTHSGHGADFQDYADRINRILGAGYVTITYDKSYEISEVTPYYILIQPHGDRFGFSVTIRLSSQQKTEILARRVALKAKLFRITDGRFLTVAVPIKRNGGFVLPRDPNSDQSVFLKNLYYSGSEILP